MEENKELIFKKGEVYLCEFPTRVAPDFQEEIILKTVEITEVFTESRAIRVRVEGTFSHEWMDLDKFKKIIRCLIGRMEVRGGFCLKEKVFVRCD